MSQTPSPPPPLPQPVQVLAYTEPLTSRRPGAVTALGVLSLIVGVLGAIAAVIGLGFSAMFMMVTAMTPMFAGMQTVGTVTEYAGPNGFNAADRTVIVAAFNRKQPMSAAQQQQLDFFLSDVGQKIVPAVNTAQGMFDPAKVYIDQNLTADAAANADGSVSYGVPIGTITVADQHVSFTPGTGVATAAVTRSRDRTLVSPSNFNQLSAADTQAVIDRVQEYAGKTPLSARQVSVLRSQLQSNPTTLVGVPPDMAEMLGQIVGVSPGVNGAVDVKFANATASLLSGGNGISTTMTYNAGPSASPVVRAKSPSEWPLLLDAALNVGLSIYLLVIGIFTLRNALSGARLHRIYVAMKVPVTILMAVAVIWMWHTFKANLLAASATSSTASIDNVAITMTIIAAVFGLGYPILVLLLLNTKSVREFYVVG